MTRCAKKPRRTARLKRRSGGIARDSARASTKMSQRRALPETLCPLHTHIKDVTDLFGQNLLTLGA